MKLIITCLFFSSVAVAKECKFLIQREVCSGKNEAELLKPYGGQKAYLETKDVGSIKECVAVAEMSAKIVRPGQFKAKQVTDIFFDGQEVKQTFEDKKECK